MTVVDSFSRFSPAINSRFSYRGEGVVEALERICRNVGYPEAIRVDEGSEFISHDFDLQACRNDVTSDLSRPGNPTDIAFKEASIRRFQTECLKARWFLWLGDAKIKLKHWRRCRDELRPHGAIGNKALMMQTNHDNAISSRS